METRFDRRRDRLARPPAEKLVVPEVGGLLRRTGIPRAQKLHDTGRTPFELAPVSLRPLLEQVLLGHYPEFEARGWEPALECDDVRVEADAEALMRIVENLVANALRHGRGPLSVPARPAGEKGRLAVGFANPVADPGALDPDRLFERFYQADSSRSTAGSGLGLSVAAKLAEAQGMTLSARLEGDSLVISLVMSAV